MEILIIVLVCAAVIVGIGCTVFAVGAAIGLVLKLWEWENFGYSVTYIAYSMLWQHGVFS
jgi:hypothetical protein